MLYVWFNGQQASWFTWHFGCFLKTTDFGRQQQGRQVFLSVGDETRACLYTSWAGDSVTIGRGADENKGRAGGRYFMQVNRHIRIKSNGGFLGRIDTQRNPEKDDQTTRPQKGGEHWRVALDQRGLQESRSQETALQGSIFNMIQLLAVYLLHSILPSWHLLSLYSVGCTWLLLHLIAFFEAQFPLLTTLFKRMRTWSCYQELNYSL